MWNRNIETFLGCDGTYEDSHIVIFGAPFDSTTSYRPGTRFAARIMRAESYGLETYSPYQDLDLEDAHAFDGGDLELPFGDTERALDMIHTFTKNILTDGRLPFLIGGEHLVSLPAIKAAAEKHPDLAVILLFFVRAYSADSSVSASVCGAVSVCAGASVCSGDGVFVSSYS